MKSHIRFIALVTSMICGKLYCQEINDQKFPYIPYRYKNLWGYCDTLGNIKIEPKYDKTEFVNSVTRLPVVKNKKKSLLDEIGKPIIGFYDTYGLISIVGGYWVLNNKKAGIITNSGDTILPISYDKLFYANRVQPYYKEDNKLIGKIGNRYYLISFVNTTSSKPALGKVILISPLPKDRPSLWELDYDFDIPPEQEPLDYKESEGINTLTTTVQDSIKNTHNLDSIEKNPFQIFFQRNTSEAFYKIYKNNRIGFWSRNHFVAPKYNTLQLGFYYGESFIAEIDRKFGIIGAAGNVLTPFKYDKIKNTGVGPFITTVNNKQGVLMVNSSYPTIKNVYDKVEFVEMLSVNSNWNFALFKVLKKGKEGYLGENGIEYFKD